MFILLFIPVVVKAEECSLDNISIEEIELLNKSDNVVQRDSIIEGKKILFDLKFEEVGNFIEYKLKIKNSTENDYKLDNNYSSVYFNYMISTEDNSNVIGKSETKEVLLRLSYVKSIPIELLNNDNMYYTNIQLLATKPNDKIVNPVT